MYPREVKGHEMVNATLVGSHASPARAEFFIGFHDNVTAVVCAIDGTSRVVTGSTHMINRWIVQCANEVLVSLTGWFQEFRIFAAVTLLKNQVDNILDPLTLLPQRTKQLLIDQFKVPYFPDKLFFGRLEMQLILALIGNISTDASRACGAFRSITLEGTNQLTFGWFW